MVGHVEIEITWISCSLGWNASSILAAAASPSVLLALLLMFQRQALSVAQAIPELCVYPRLSVFLPPAAGPGVSPMLGIQ